MKTLHVLTVSLLAMTSLVHGQGSLTPPGAPGATMKTLDQLDTAIADVDTAVQEVEPRTPITSLPYTIDQPGSYYLTGNLSSTGDGIRIETSGVTLDLNGFSLTGDSQAWENGLFIRGTVAVPLDGIRVRNGVIENFGNGLRAEQTSGSRFENLIIRNVTDSGIRLEGSGAGGGCPGNVFTSCSIINASFYGISFSAANGGKVSGNRILNCTINGAGATGIRLSGEVTNNDIVESAITDTDGNGILISGSGNRVIMTSVSGSSSAGFRVSGDANVFTKTLSRDNASNGFIVFGDRNVIEESAVHDNLGGGIAVSGSGAGNQANGNQILGCTITNNNSRGIFAYGDSGGESEGNRISGNSIHNHSFAGIDLQSANGNRVEGNHVSADPGVATVGIRSLNTERNIIVKNTSIGAPSNFIIDADDTYGPIISASGEIVSTNPWANFSR